MKVPIENRKWNWLDTFLFFVRTFWIYFNASMVIEVNTDDTKKWLFFLWFIAIYLVPYLFYRPGFIKFPYYLVAEVLLTGSLFLLLMNQFGESDIYDFLYLPFITIAYACQRKPLVWIGPLIGLALFFSGAWQGGLFTFENNIFGEFINICIFYGFGFSLGRVTVLNNKMKVLIESIKEKNRTLEQYSKRIEELTIMEERNRVSQDLHDTVGHIFTSVITSLDALPYLIKANKVEVEMSIIEISDMARKGLDDVRNTIHQLSPMEDHQPLSVSFHSVIDDFRKHTGTKVDFTIEGVEQGMGERIKFTLIRCLQESLTNAKRHGEASHVTARLFFQEESVMFQLQDNGIGSNELTPGFGLVSMNDRLSALHGTFKIHSKANQGTKITCTIPLVKKEIRTI
ncbi:sensor histidine kinase [Neobacillus sp. NPDC093127]|uniref:sensor histidine kinase n=1 Tax=Neobacillus sp. NPDC093127 TaxID=3364296 RepID=UPI0038091108